ncbi:hypothetical protein OG21DRAFT_274489 [Imleria badia]|nr:hypothetical protein OG21DRAFT_274489 [Imleria badia]
MQWPDYWVHCATPQAHNRTQKLIPGPRHPSGVSPCYFKIRGNRRLVAPQSFTCYVGIYPICLASWVSLGSVNSPHPLQSPTLPPTCLSPLRLVMTSRVHCIRAPPTLSDRSLRSVYIIYVAFSPPLVLPNRALQVHLTTCLFPAYRAMCGWCPNSSSLYQTTTQQRRRALTSPSLTLPVRTRARALARRSDDDDAMQRQR